jgi:hypothetical protein
LPLLLITTEKSIRLPGVKYMRSNIRKTTPLRECPQYCQFCQLPGVFLLFIIQMGKCGDGPDRVGPCFRSGLDGTASALVAHIAPCGQGLRLKKESKRS